MDDEEYFPQPDFYLGSYINNFLNDCFKIKKYLPIEMCPEKTLIFTFEGFGSMVIVVQDETLNNVLRICGEHLKFIKKIYGKKNLFSDPIFMFTPEGKFILKVGMMSKEFYKMILESRKKAK
jgi:hypothetical protein